MPLPIRPPAVRLRHAREDHATCLALAASYRHRLARGEPCQREQHASALAHARTLRVRHVDLSAAGPPPA